MFAYFCGEFVNSYVLARMKIRTAGKWLWSRTIGSTVAGEAVDSALFYPLAFYGAGIIPDATPSAKPGLTLSSRTTPPGSSGPTSSNAMAPEASRAAA